MCQVWHKGFGGALVGRRLASLALRVEPPLETSRVRRSDSTRARTRPSWALGVWALGVWALGVACLNPMPDDFPNEQGEGSSSPPTGAAGSGTGDPAGDFSGAGGGGGSGGSGNVVPTDGPDGPEGEAGPDGSAGDADAGTSPQADAGSEGADGGR